MLEVNEHELDKEGSYGELRAGKEQVIEGVIQDIKDSILNMLKDANEVAPKFHPNLETCSSSTERISMVYRGTPPKHNLLQTDADGFITS